MPGVCRELGRGGMASETRKFILLNSPTASCHGRPSQRLYSWPSEKDWQADSRLSILSADKAQFLTHQLYPL